MERKIEETHLTELLNRCSAAEAALERLQKMAHADARAYQNYVTACAEERDYAIMGQLAMLKVLKQIAAPLPACNPPNLNQETALNNHLRRLQGMAHSAAKIADEYLAKHTGKEIGEDNARK